jgi:hypothetical protein
MTARRLREIGRWSRDWAAYYREHPIDPDLNPIGVALITATEMIDELLDEIERLGLEIEDLEMTVAYHKDAAEIAEACIASDDGGERELMEILS